MKICKVPDCNNGVNETKGAFGYCGKHYMRVKRYGDPHYITPESIRRENSRKAQPKLGRCKKTTYKKLLGRHEHRVIAEQVLGRKLLSSEHVHHIDGNKHNNDPKNLAVLTRLEHLRTHGKNFTPEQIREIRKSTLSQQKIADLFKCSQSNISEIKSYKTYKDII